MKMFLIGLLTVILFAGTADIMEVQPIYNLSPCFAAEVNLTKGAFPEGSETSADVSDFVSHPLKGDISTGEGILRQWSGDAVCAKVLEGHWSHGLAVFFYDQFYEAQTEKGGQHRKDLLVNYENYVTSKRKSSVKDPPLKDGPSSEVIDYVAGAMFFHMLENLVGKDPFRDALKGLFREKEICKTTWADLKIAFDKASGRNLEWFFRQWLDRKEIPSIEVKNPKVEVLKGVWKVSFDIIQKSEPFRLNLPAVVKTDKGEVTRILDIKKEKETFEISTPGEPVEIIIDRDYDLMRMLSDRENPPVISKLLGDEQRLIIIPETEAERYRDLITLFKAMGFAAKNEIEIKDEDIKQNSLMIPGIDGSVLKRLFGGFGRPDSGLTITVKRNPLNPSKVIAIAHSDSDVEIIRALKELPLYGRYSYLRFETGKDIESDIIDTEKGIRVNLREPVIGIQPQKTVNLDEIIVNILDKPIIYVGERHANFEDHRVQLKVIMSLQEGGRKFAVGMEMFQKPFQKAINDYLSGVIEEREFLRATQYFKRWQFDYNLYREILDYARVKNIPIVALNMWSEIVKTVAAGGLDALTDSEKTQIPQDMDMSDADYRQRLREIFETHKNHENKNFDNFYQAQILWDETMAHSVDAFLKKNPDYQMVVLAGAGHIMHGSGIPKRSFRLNGKDYVTLVPGADMSDDDLGDYILSPDHIPPPDTVKIGVALKKINGKVGIEKIQPLSIAEKNGLKRGDIVVSVDDWEIEDIDDVWISLFDKRRGEKIKIKILRKKFLSGYKELEFEVAL